VNRDGSLRYTHRREGDTDLYFVANRAAFAVRATCTFRVERRRPELWDPMSGAVRSLSQFHFEGGRTVVPLEFEPHGSYFIVFRHAATEPRTRKTAAYIRGSSRRVSGPAPKTNGQENRSNRTAPGILYPNQLSIIAPTPLPW
jgi:hypothetical protein